MPVLGLKPVNARAWSCLRAVALFVLAAGPLCGAAVAANTEGRSIGDWRSIQHPRRGFMIAYPATVFAKRSAGSSEDGEVLVSRDGTSKLLVGTFENTAQFSMKAYRDYLLEHSYAGARIDYEKWHPRWFVISGTVGDTMFYERVTFTCGGKLVNSWAMLYPVAARSFYDRVVEGVARTYSPGAGAAGRCE